MSYEDILIQESTGEGGGWSLDRTEATAEWFDNFREEDGHGEEVCVPASPWPLQLMYGGPRSFAEWLESHGYYLPLPNSFQEWLDRGNDAI